MSQQAQLSERSSSTEDAGPLTPGGAGVQQALFVDRYSRLSGLTQTPGGAWEIRVN